MIRSKDEIVFLTKNAMACISVTGAQYPVRDQKLVLLGEDVAVLEEAIRERENCHGRNNATSPRTTGSNTRTRASRHQPR